MEKESNIVNPNKVVTLTLNGAYQPSGYFSARATIRHLITGKIKALDKYGNTLDWDQWNARSYDCAYENTPALRSASQTFLVPTVVIITHYFGYRKFKGRKQMSLRQIYKLYKGVCQFTLKKIPYSEASIDHVYPRSKGGPDDICNVVLCSKTVNSKKSDTYPYYDVNGNEVKPKIFTDFHHITATEARVRDEWKPFLYQT